MRTQENRYWNVFAGTSDKTAVLGVIWWAWALHLLQLVRIQSSEKCVVLLQYFTY
jgi:hypothetical protein